MTTKTYGKCPETGKVKYESRKDAKHARQEHKFTGGYKYPLSVFICDFCGWFHIGSKRVHGKDVSRLTHRKINSNK